MTKLTYAIQHASNPDHRLKCIDSLQADQTFEVIWSALEGIIHFGDFWHILAKSAISIFSTIRVNEKIADILKPFSSLWYGYF